MTLVHVPDFIGFAELTLLQSLTSPHRRPNLLVVSTTDAARGSLAGGRTRSIASTVRRRLNTPSAITTVPSAMPAAVIQTIVFGDV